MNTIHTRWKVVRAAVVAGSAATARRAQKKLIVLVLALGAILLTLSAPTAHAGPVDGPGDTPSPPHPLQLHASENPVYCDLFQTTKEITLTWKNPHPEQQVHYFITDNGEKWIGGNYPPAADGIKYLQLTCGHTYAAHLEIERPPLGPPYEYSVGPTLTITTKRPETSTPIPQPPHIDPTLIPSRPDLN